MRRHASAALAMTTTAPTAAARAADSPGPGVGEAGGWPAPGVVVDRGPQLGLSLPGGVQQAGSAGWAAPLGWVLASALLAAVTAAPARTLLRPGAGLAVTAGLLYAAGDVATKAAVGGTSPVWLFSEPMPGGIAGVSRTLGFAGAVLGAALLAGRAGEPAA